MEWSKRKYNENYEYYMPWIEDKLLGWWGENKTSYTAKQNMKTDVTGVAPVNKVQSGVAEGVGGQLDNDGLLGGVGKLSSKEGMNRIERDEHNKQTASWTDSGKNLAGKAGGMVGLGGGEGEKK